jgi:hypothetical protein
MAGIISLHLMQLSADEECLSPGQACEDRRHAVCLITWLASIGCHNSHHVVDVHVGIATVQS